MRLQYVGYDHIVLPGDVKIGLAVSPGIYHCRLAFRPDEI